MGLNVILPLLGGLAVVAVLAVVILMKNRTAYLGPVREELQKEKAWLRRGEYNAAMVRGRQNLELLLKLVAEKNGIRLDNSAKAQEEAERQNQNRGKKTPQVMTHHQFNRWLSENGYIDRVARWELNQVRVIGNKAVHENYADKDDAWNQFNYLEDVLKTITERSQNPKKRQEQVKQQAEKPKQQVEKPKQTESEQQDQTPKKKRRRKKKSAQPKQNAPEIKETAAVEVQKPKQVKKAQPEKVQQEAPQEEQAVEKKKPRRRRRRKKSQNPQNPQVQTEAVKPLAAEKEAKPAESEPKKSEPKKAEPKKESAVTKEGEQKANPHKRRRRRRPRKPQTAQEQNSSGE